MIEKVKRTSATLFPRGREPFGLVMIEHDGNRYTQIGWTGLKKPETVAHGKLVLVCHRAGKMDYMSSSVMQIRLADRFD